MDKYIFKYLKLIYLRQNHSAMSYLYYHFIKRVSRVKCILVQEKVYKPFKFCAKHVNQFMIRNRLYSTITLLSCLVFMSCYHIMSQITAPFVDIFISREVSNILKEIQNVMTCAVLNTS